MTFVFFLICFGGVAFMFFCLMRRLDILSRSLREEKAQTKALLQLLAQRLSTELAPVPVQAESSSEVQENIPLKNATLELKQQQKSAMPDINM